MKATVGRLSTKVFEEMKTTYSFKLIHVCFFRSDLVESDTTQITEFGATTHVKRNFRAPRGNMEEMNIVYRRETTETHHPQISKKINETETTRTRDLFRISKDLTKANSNIRQLEDNLASTVREIETLNHSLRTAYECKRKIENEIRREQNEKERLTTELTKARGFFSEAELSKNLELVDMLGVTKTNEKAVFDGKMFGYM